MLVYGADLEVPLSDRVSLAGSANLLTPAMTGTVNAFLGISFYPWRTNAARSGFTPPMGVANNPSFAVDLSR